MEQTVREVMTRNPVTCRPSQTVADAARAMRDNDIGDILVEENGQLMGIVTDRDIVVRCVAEGANAASAQLSQLLSRDVITVSPETPIRDAIEMMRDKAVRRFPVVEQGKAIGVFSIGDLALMHDPGSALADISAAPPNR